MYRRSNARILLWLMALCAVGAQGQAAAQSKQTNSIQIRVESVLATDTNQGMDARLASTSIGDRLKSVFDYTTYRLLKHDEESTVFGQAIAFNLPRGRILHVAPLAIAGNMIAMELVLFEGAHSLMRTELKMTKGGMLILVGPRYPQATYITMIGAEPGSISKVDTPASAGIAGTNPGCGAESAPAPAR
jgi:hypothetical protein